MEILVFKTSVVNQLSVRTLKPELDRLAGKGKWNFDLADCDNILRIVSEIQPQKAIQLLGYFGFDCIELEDKVPVEPLLSQLETKG
jgi:hypothetical protein